MVSVLNDLPIGASLVWLWAWDIIRDKFNNYSQDDFANDYTVTDGTTLDVIWEKLWDNPPADFTLEYGAELMDEAVMDWMIDNEFIASLDDDGWLDEDSDEESDNTTEHGQDLALQGGAQGIQKGNTMTTKREYLASKGITVGKRGRFSGAAKQALSEAEKNGIKFTAEAKLTK